MAKLENLGASKPVVGLVVANWCGTLDEPRMPAHLASETALKTDAPEVVPDVKDQRMAT